MTEGLARFFRVADRVLKVLIIAVAVGLWSSSSLLRALAVSVVVIVIKFAVDLLIGSLAHRRHADLLHVICVSNTVILGGVIFAIDQFADEGMTAYSVFIALLMLWLTSRAAGSGTIGVQVIQADRARVAGAAVIQEQSRPQRIQGLMDRQDRLQAEIEVLEEEGREENRRR